jgi:hypothetical protein
MFNYIIKMFWRIFDYIFNWKYEKKESSRGENTRIHVGHLPPNMNIHENLCENL